MPSNPETTICKKCEKGRYVRRARVGFIQEVVMPFFRMFPWECNKCGYVIYSRDRGRIRSRRHEPMVPGLEPASLRSTLKTAERTNTWVA